MPMELRAVVKAFGLARSVTPGEHRGTVGGVEVVARTSGMGTRSAASATEALLDETGVGHVVICGIAGGLSRELGIADVVVPEVVLDGSTGVEYRPAPLGNLTAAGRIVTFNELQTDPEVVTGLIESGLATIDMETAAVAAVCERRGVPWSVVRSVSDRVGVEPVDDEVFAMANPDGSVNGRAAVRYVLHHPLRVPALIRLGTYGTRAAAAAARAAAAGCRAAG